MLLLFPEKPSAIIRQTENIILQNPGKKFPTTKKRAEQLLQNAHSLMDIYREDRMNEWNAFLLSDARVSGKRRNILSAPPLYTMEADFLIEFFGWS